jgi:hypothetical protein
VDAVPGVVFVNPSAGSELSAEEVGELFSGHRVVDCPGEEIPERVAVATVEVALDGDVERIEAPLRYSVRREELAVLVPPDADAE